MQATARRVSVVSSTSPARRRLIRTVGQKTPMKALLLFLMPGCIFAAEPRTFKLDYKEGEKVDYSPQIQAKFKQLVSSDPALAKEFEQYEAPPPKNAQGRYDGVPAIQVITLSQSENVDFRDSGGTKEFEIEIALYYRFDEGVHRGRQTSSGFFAHFTVTGNLTYRHLDNDEFELAKSQVAAKFQGFSRTLAAPKPEEDGQAEKDGRGAGDKPSK